ncbi:hypothetical protein HK104_009752 [Borealophlyctis nickersoniae]|nr:hypothetical protein HK104_009752 [Borealophlyctis nickersoniae]
MDQYFTTTFHLLMVFRSLPNLVSLSLGFLTDEPVSWGKNLRLAEEEEDEIWRMGLGNLKALKIGLMEQSHTGGIMLGKLALGLGERLEMMHVGLRDPGTDDQIAQLLRNLSNNCPRLVDLSFEGWNPNSLQPFLKTQRQIVQLALKNMNVSDRFLRTIVASCTNLRFLEFDAGDNIPSATYKHLAKLPFLRGLSIHGNGVDRIAKTDVVEFLRCRGKDLEYLKFPRGRIGAFPGLVEFLPNIRHFSTWYQYPFDYVVDFLDSAPKLESIQLCTEGWIVEMLEEVWDHDVELNYEDHDFRMQMHDHVESKKEAWMGL